MNAIDPVELIRRLERARDVADDLLVTSTGSASVKWRAQSVAFNEAIRLVRDAKWWAYTTVKIVVSLLEKVDGVKP